MSAYRYGNQALSVACPTCRQPVGRWCRTRITDRVTDIHLPRYDLLNATTHPPTPHGEALRAGEGSS